MVVKIWGPVQGRQEDILLIMSTAKIFYIWHEWKNYTYCNNYFKFKIQNWIFILAVPAIFKLTEFSDKLNSIIMWPTSRTSVLQRLKHEKSLETSAPLPYIFINSDNLKKAVLKVGFGWQCIPWEQLGNSKFSLHIQLFLPI